MSIRSAVVAGSFYPGTKELLKNEVYHYLQSNSSEKIAKNDPVWAVMLPHAGYFYCGSIIGKTLQNITLPKRLIILSPNHTGYGTPFSVWEKGSWLTPLDPVKVDSELASQILTSGGGFQADVMAHLREHSIEVLLPFLQVATPDMEIVPITIGTQNLAALHKAATALASVLAKPENQDVGLIISSDMNHYENDKITLKKDELALAEIEAMNPEKLLEQVKRNKISMCGAAPMALAVMTANQLGDFDAKVVCHDTSGTASGDYNKVVGYAGVVLKPISRTNA